MNTKFCLAFLVPLFILAIAGNSPAQDIKRTIDEAIHEIRLCQNQDGSYGPSNDQPDTTSLVLIAMALSPRQYTDLDGPFVRKAADRLAAGQNEDGSIEPGPKGKKFLSTALAVAALDRINSGRYREFLAEALSFLTRNLVAPENEYDPETLFAASWALSGIDPDVRAIFVSGKIKEERGGRFSNSFRLASKLLAQAALPEDSGIKHLEYLQKSKPTSPMELLAASVFFTLLEKKGKPAPFWADELSRFVLGDTRDPGGSMFSREQGLSQKALLISVLSLCHKSSAKAPSSQPPTELAPLPPVVEAPLPLDSALAKALAYLDENQDSGKFGFPGYDDPGITAMALSAAIRSSRILERDPPSYVNKGLEYLYSLKKEDGSIYLTGLRTYVTSVSLMAFKDSENPRYAEAVTAARDFLIAVQADEGEGYSLEEDFFYGGMGYGGDERPDLSNTQMSLDALRAAGLDEKHEAYQKALQFVKKCQNTAEVNPTQVVLSNGKKVVAGTDGGGIYYPGSSKAGLEEVDQGVYVARSYGSMTYALLKSYIFTGLDGKDKRVQAAVKWVEEHYTLDENPGFISAPGTDTGQQGLFYYYLTMARALDALDREIIKDSRGVEHIWRKELTEKLLGTQRIDGSWINERSPRWFEGNPVLATSYALLTLDICAQ